MRFRVELVVETAVEVTIEAPNARVAQKRAREQFLNSPAAHLAGGFNSDWAVMGTTAREVADADAG